MSHMQVIPSSVLSIFQAFSPEDRDAFLDARELIFDVAATDLRIGILEETLRWGEPAYITTSNKTGSTIRLGTEKTSGMLALFFNCKTTLVEEFRQQFGEVLTYSKNRAVLIQCGDSQIRDALKICIASALTYHLRPKLRKTPAI